MTNPTTLVHTPAATKFVGDMQLNSFRRAFMGDPATLPEAVRASVTQSHEGMKDSLVTLAKLANDPTKNDVLKHEAAQTLATRLDGVLAKTQGALESHASSLSDAANARIDDYFKPNPSNVAIDMKTIEWLQDNFRTPDGLAKIRAASKSHSDVARAIHHSPSYLLGISEEIRTDFYYAAIQRFVPDAYGALETSGKLHELSKKYDDVRKGVRTSFFNPSIAEQAKRRVEV